MFGLLGASANMIKNDGFSAWLRAVGEEMSGRVRFRATNYSNLYEKARLYLETSETIPDRPDLRIIYSEGEAEIDEDLRRDIRIGSSEISALPGNPRISIIIPTLDQTGLLERNLEAIESRTTYRNYEIIVVTNNGDKSSGMRRYLEGIGHTVLVYDREYSFSDVNNHASGAASGEYLLFLNDDAEPVSPDWLEAMLKLALDGRVGAVGGKLLFPDGSLQEAGCIVWRNGSAWNYGRGDDPGKADYNFVREVDYCSGSCLMVRRDVFEQVGGFDRRYRPAYAEDSDICHAIRQKGYGVLYQPLSCIVHHEGRTQGRDVSTGIKSFQIENQKKFREKWGGVLRDRCLSSPLNVLLERNRTEGLNILYLDRRIPEYDKDSGSLDAYYTLSIMASLGHNVTFWPADPDRLEPYATELQQKRIEVVYGRGDFREFLTERGGAFHVCFVAGYNIAAKYHDLLKRHAPECKIILDTVDLHFIRECREAALTKNPSKMISANRTKGSELSIIGDSDMSVVRTHKEANFLLGEIPDLSIAVMPTLQIPKSGAAAPFEKRRDMLFVGGFQHAPNVDAIEYLIRDILPQIIRSLPGVRLYVVGSNASKRVRDLCAAAEGVVFVGYLPDMDAYLEGCRIMLAPLRFGAGMKRKITQAFACGLPVVTTPIGAEGISSVEDRTMLIEDDPAGFADAAVRAYEDGALWNTLSENCLVLARRRYSPELVRDTIKRVLARCLLDKNRR